MAAHERNDRVLPSPYPSESNQMQQLERKKAVYRSNQASLLMPTGSRADLINGSELGAAGFGPVTTALIPVKVPTGFESITKKMSQYLLQTYVTCNPNFVYQPINNPRRVLTKPAIHSGNDGYDNTECDYILYVNDILGATEGHQYQIMDALGSGTFGQVVKCQNIKTKELIALKVIKNKPAYYNQSLIEVEILDQINTHFDPRGTHHIVRMKDSFVFRNHLCIGFEILSVNLYELIKQNQYRGLSTNLIRIFVRQILDALTILKKAKLIHCDLKPENILLQTLESPLIKVIDLGSACHENQTVYTYIQSRFYRSPEVLLGLPYTGSIDVWSLGCIAAELFLGLPLFPGTSEYNQISRIVELLGMPPTHMCNKSKNASQFFNKVVAEDKSKKYFLKDMFQYMKEQGATTELPSKRYFKGTSLPEIINSYPIMRKGLSSKEIEAEMENRRSFIDFLQGLLRLNPLERWTPQQAATHPFITQKPFLEPHMPTSALHKISTRLQSPFDAREMSPTTRPARRKTNVEQVVGTFSEFQINSPTTPINTHGINSIHNINNSINSPTEGYRREEYPMRKAKSQYSVADEFNYSRGDLGYSRGELQSYNSSPGLNSAYSFTDEYYVDGHPRHGGEGERLRLPSRMPSTAASVDWELFRDYEGGASAAGSYASSRQGSFQDMSGSRSSSFVDDGRRQSYASPTQSRHMPFHSRNSNESFTDPSRFGRATDQHPFTKTHKKVKSSSSFGSMKGPRESTRRPSVPNNFYPPSLHPLQFESDLQHIDPQSDVVSPGSKSKPIDLPKKS